MIEIPEIQKRFAKFQQGSVVHEVPVKNLGTKVSLELADAYDNLNALREKLSGASLTLGGSRELIEAFHGVLAVCIVDFEQWRFLFDNLPLSIDLYEKIFGEILDAMMPDDPSKKKTIGESPGSELISGSEKPATPRRKSRASTDSAD